MRRRALQILDTIVLLELLAAGGVKGTQSQSNCGDLAEVWVNSASGRQWPLPDTPRQDTFGLSRSWKEARRSEGTGIGFRISPPVVKRPPSRRSLLLIGLYVSHVILQGLDAQSTMRALGTGTAREGNPILSPIASHPAALISFKAALAVGTIYAIDRLHKYHPRLASSTLGTINGGYAFIVQRNYRSFPAR